MQYPSNTVPARNAYPTFDGGTSLGDYATSPFAFDGNNQVANDKVSDNAVDKALAVGMAGEPIRWWVSLVVLLIVLMYFSQKFDGGEGNYSNLRLSAYNIVTVTLSAIIGLSIFKVVFTKFPVPGLSTVVLAA